MRTGWDSAQRRSRPARAGCVSVRPHHWLWCERHNSQSRSSGRSPGTSSSSASSVLCRETGGCFFPKLTLASAHQLAHDDRHKLECGIVQVPCFTSPILLSALFADQPVAPASPFDTDGSIATSATWDRREGRVDCLAPRGRDVVVQRGNRIHDESSGMSVAASKPRSLPGDG